MKKLISVILLILCVIKVFPQYQIPLHNSSFVNKTKIKSNDSDHEYTFNFSGLNSLNIDTKEGSFTQLILEGSYRTGKIGEPELPSIKKLIEVPYGAEPTVEIISYDVHEYFLKDYGVKNKLMPAQLSYSKNTDPSQKDFKIKKDVYKKDAYLSMPFVNILPMGTLRGYTLAQLTINPVKYNPVKNSIKVFNNIKVKVRHSGGNPAYNEIIKSKSISPYFKSIDNNFSTASKSSTNDYTGYEDHTKYPIKYLIVTPAEFETELLEFINWKTRKGFEVVVANTDDIGHTATDIKFWIQEQFHSATEQDPAPTFLLLIGDIGQLPASQNGDATYAATDLYYACVDGTDDIFPDMYYGRLSAQNVTQLNNMIDKILYYEKYEFTDDSYLNEVTLIAGTDASWNPAIAQPTIKYGTENYFNTANGFSTVNAYLSSYTGCYDTERIEVGLINYTAHCNSTSWSGPYLSASSVNTFQNNGKYPLAIGNCCQSGNFGISECIGEAWMRVENGGAIAYIGSSPDTYWYEDFYWSVGAHPYVSGNYPTVEESTLGAYDAPYLSDYLCVDALRFVGNLAVTTAHDEGYTSSISTKYYWEAYNCLSDPSINVYLTTGSENTVSHASSLTMGINEFDITAEPGSYVGISKDNILLGAALVNETGSVTIPITPVISAGLVDIVVTKAQYKPYITQIATQLADNAFLAIDEINIIDDSGNGQIEYGETFNMELQIKNIGSQTAQNIVASITSNDEFIQLFTDNIGNPCLDITSENIGTISDKFFIKIKDSIPDQHQILFNIELEENSGEEKIYSYQRSITLNAPVLQLDSEISIDDSEYNSNGRLESGETGKLLVKLSNSGHAEINTNSKLSLKAEDDYFTIINENYNITIQPNETVSAEFIVKATGSIHLGHSVNLDLLVKGGVSEEYEYTLNYDLEIGEFYEITIGEGTETVGSYPFNNYYENNKTQILYYNDEISTKPKLITELGFDIASATGDANYRDLNNFQIKLAHSSLTSMSAYVDLSDAQIVYARDIYHLSGNTGMEYFELDSAFIYNGTDNIIVEIIWGDNGKYVSEASRTRVYSSITDVNTVAFGQSDTQTPPLLSGTKRNRPNIYMKIDKAYSLNFVVTDKDAEPVILPIENAEITIGNDSILTNNTGLAKFIYPTARLGLNYTCNLEGYYPLSGTVDLDTLTITDTLRMQKIPQYLIQFHVISNNVDVENAFIKFGNFSGYTNSNGILTFNKVYESSSENYTVSLEDYHIYTGTTAIDTDKNIEIELIPDVVTPKITEVIPLKNKQAKIIWKGLNSNNKAFVNYNLYLNNLLLSSNYTDTSIILSDLINGKAYNFSVEAVYTNITLPAETYNFNYAELLDINIKILDDRGALRNVSLLFNQKQYISNSEGVISFSDQWGQAIPYSIYYPGYYTINNKLNLYCDTNLMFVLSPVPDINFHVVNSIGKPLENTTITLNNSSVFTNKNGYYSFADADTSITHYYSIELQNHITISDSLILFESDTLIEAILHKLPHVSFQITNLNGTNLSMAEIQLGALISQSNEVGESTFEHFLPGNQIPVKIHLDSYFTYYDTLNISNNDTLLNITLIEIPDINFHISVDGKPSNNASVLFGNDTLKTNEFGQATFIDIMPGKYSYKITDDSCYEVFDTLNLDSLSQSLSVELIKIPDVEFFISDGTRSIAMAEVRFDQQIAYTDTLGKVVFHKVKAGTYDYSVIKENYISIVDSITINENDINKALVMEPVRFDVKIVVNDGTHGIENAFVEFNNNTKLTNNEGVAMFNGVLPGEKYSYLIRKNAFQSAEGKIDIFGNMELEIPLELITYNVLFNVLDDNGVLPGARVILSDSIKYTNNQGKAVFENIIPSENLKYSVEKDNTHVKIEDLLSLNSNKTIDILLHLVTINSNAFNKILIYPNPTNGVFTFEISQPDEQLKVTISDESGRVIKEIKHFQQKNKIDLSNHSKGLYILNIHSKNINHVEKLILE